MTTLTTAMTTAEVRTRIAQDALAQLQAQRLVATKMTYLTTGKGYYRDFLTGAQLKETTCYVCAQGALVIGYMTRRADERLGDYDERSHEVETIFGFENLELIEACFEGFGTDDGVGVEYRYAWGDNDKRLEKILQNLIRNGGEFRPHEDLSAAA